MSGADSAEGDRGGRKSVSDWVSSPFPRAVVALETWDLVRGHGEGAPEPNGRHPWFAVFMESLLHSPLVGLPEE